MFFTRHRIALHLASDTTTNHGETGDRIVATALDDAVTAAIEAGGKADVGSELPSAGVGAIEWLAILGPLITSVISGLTAKIADCGGPKAPEAAAQIASPVYSESHVRIAANEQAKRSGFKGRERRECRDRIVAGVLGISAEQKQKALDEIGKAHDDGIMF